MSALEGQHLHLRLADLDIRIAMVRGFVDACIAQGDADGTAKHRSRYEELCAQRHDLEVGAQILGIAAARRMPGQRDDLVAALVSLLALTSQQMRDVETLATTARTDPAYGPDPCEDCGEPAQPAIGMQRFARCATCAARWERERDTNETAAPGEGAATEEEG